MGKRKNSEEICKDGKKHPQDMSEAREALAKSGKAKQSKDAKQSVKQCISKSIKNNKGANPSSPRRVTPEVQDAVRTKLTEREENGHLYMVNFVNNFLNEARDNPNSLAARQLASVIFDQKLLQTLDEEVNKQMNKDISFSQYQVRKTLYPKQIDVYDDDFDKIILAICSRRVGKSELDGRLLAKRCLRPEQHCVYINRSFEVAARQINKPLMTALEAAGLTNYTGTVGGGMLTFDNGSWILIIGNNNAKDIDKLRGEKIALCIADECGHMRNMRQIVQEVIEPAMMDYADSQLIFTGTPPRTKHNFIQELYDNPTIRKFHWTYLDNPFLPNREKILQEVCDRHGVNPNDPFIRREYFGEMGAVDEEAIVFHDYKTTTEIPKKTWTHAYIGVDWGFEDKAAVVSVLGDSHTKQCIIIKTWSASKKGISEICQEVKNQYDILTTKYTIARKPVIVCDTNEKSASFELYQTYKLPNVMNAYKYEKNFAIEQLAEWLRTSTIITYSGKENEEMLLDLDNTIWQRDEETDELQHEIDDEAYHPNAAMALLYISRMIAYDILGVVTPESEIRARRLIENV